MGEHQHLTELGAVIKMSKQVTGALMGIYTTNHVIRMVVLAIAVAFAIWTIIHFGHPVPNGHGADGVTWVERLRCLSRN